MITKKKKKHNSENNNNKSNYQTITYYDKNKLHFKIYTELAKISKNIYNSTIYCIKIFNYFKLKLYKNLYKQLKINPLIDTSKFIKNQLINYHELYSKLSKHIKINHNYIYKYIIGELKSCKIIIKNSNYEKYICYFQYILKKDPNIFFNGVNDNLLFYDIVEEIIKSMYKRNYGIIKKEMYLKKPFSFIDNEIILDINNDNILDFSSKNTYKIRIKNKFNIVLKSDINYIGRLVYAKLENNYEKIDSTMIGSIIDKAYKAYNSYYALLNKGIKSSQPKYLKNDDLYSLIYSYSKVIKIKKVIKNDNNFKEKNKLKLFTSQNMSKNFSSVIGEKYIQLGNNKYIDNRFLISVNKKINKKDNYIINDKYIEKNCEKIIDSRYIVIDLPEKIIDKEIKIIEIIFQNNIPKICITYINEIENTKEEYITSEESISIDLGMANLMTIYNPTGEQKIISGKYLSSINNYYNKEISKAQSNKNNKKVNKLNNKRTNIINNYFNLAIKWIEKEYSGKKQIIIGYNKDWKKGCNMGSKTNRRFYGIPYCKLINKLKNKLRNIKLIEESYTSKCDALSLEKICRHEDYKGKRINRGLYSSEKRKLLNADLNGAINIMRKIYDLTAITGMKIYNPVRINIFHEVVKPVDNAQ